MDTLFWVLIAICGALLLYGLYAVIQAGRNQQDTKDHFRSEAKAKHPILTNPIFWVYILLPLAVLIGSAVLYWLMP